MSVFQENQLVTVQTDFGAKPGVVLGMKRDYTHILITHYHWAYYETDSGNFRQSVRKTVRVKGNETTTTQGWKVET